MAKYHHDNIRMATGEGIYEVRAGADGGRVRRVAPLARTRVGKLLGTLCSQGYMRAVLSKPNAKPYYVRLHTLILVAFVGKCPDGHEACHRDDNRLNNTIENLYWGTRSHNLNDAVRNGRHGCKTKPQSYRRGGDHHSARLTNPQRAEILRQFELGSMTKTALAQRYGVAIPTISRVVSAS